jgi:hypothetical protein
MTRHQTVHIGMINSFNVITGVATIEEVVNSSIGILAHVPNDDELEHIGLMIYYFQEHEMYEHCGILKKYIQDNYHEDGSRKESECECEYPKIGEYARKMKCLECNKSLRR